ncbi:hypothetical protein GCM10009741_00920 [Kribbella lupini]|uniref:Uncharacterized protein n=1 Tax=Kribbella lupini TaxID=291602 RepID=A0ABN1ZZU6_9ACTN
MREDSRQTEYGALLVDHEQLVQIGSLHRAQEHPPMLSDPRGTIRSEQTRCAVSEHLPTGLSSVAVAQ